MLGKTLVLAAAAVVTCAGASRGAAQQLTDLTDHVTVRYADLDTATPSGARTLLRRLDRASMDACGGNPAFHSLYMHMWQAMELNYRACHDRALKASVNALGIPRVSLLYAAIISHRSGQELARR